MFLLCVFLFASIPDVSAFPEPPRKDLISVCTGLLRDGWHGVRRLFWKTERERLRALLHERDDHVNHLRQVLFESAKEGLEQEELAIAIFRESGGRLWHFVRGEGDADVDQALKAIGAKQDLDFFGGFLRTRLDALLAEAPVPGSPQSERIAKIQETLRDYGELLSLDLFGDSPR